MIISESRNKHDRMVPLQKSKSSAARTDTLANKTTLTALCSTMRHSIPLAVHYACNTVRMASALRLTFHAQYAHNKLASNGGMDAK